MKVDPYVYPGTNVLKNKEGIRDANELEDFERIVTGHRLIELPSQIPLTIAGYRQIHRHIFQDLYTWAGKFRTVDISRGNDMFCRVRFVDAEMNTRFHMIGDEQPWSAWPADQFARCLAAHLSEINAIHPFREGNGRTMRAFMDVAAMQSGHALKVEKIEPTEWLEASIDSFRSGDVSGFEKVIRRISGLAEP